MRAAGYSSCAAKSVASQSSARSARMSSSLAPVAERACRAGAARPGYVYGYAWVPRAAGGGGSIDARHVVTGRACPSSAARAKNGCRRRKRDSVLVAYGYTHAYHSSTPSYPIDI